jgi:RNA polymerase sigma factor (TIGR02999 family)
VAGSGSTSRHAVTRLLNRSSLGDEDALAQLMPLVYADLRRVAARRIQGERNRHSFQPTALVHDAYLRLVSGRQRPANRAHFFAIAARAMRQILVDRARERGALKRGGDDVRVTLADDIGEAHSDVVDVVAVHEALEKLSTLNAAGARKARVVELRCFAGASEEEAALALGVSVGTVKRDWAFARAWLRKELGPSS